MKFLDRGYINLTPVGQIKKFTEYFAIPKGEDDIRMVFNGTKEGLTEALWALSFWIPNATSMLRKMSYNHKPVGIDLGEYFINLPLDNKLRI